MSTITIHRHLRRRSGKTAKVAAALGIVTRGVSIAPFKRRRPAATFERGEKVIFRYFANLVGGTIHGRSPDGKSYHVRVDAKDADFYGIASEPEYDNLGFPDSDMTVLTVNTKDLIRVRQ